MKLVLSASGDDDGESPSTCYMDISQEQATSLLRLQARVVEFTSAVSYEGLGCGFMHVSLGRGSRLPWPELVSFEAEVGEHDLPSNPAILSGDRTWLEGREMFGTECERVCVDKDSVFFTFYQKHCGALLSTGKLTTEQLICIAHGDRPADWLVITEPVKEEPEIYTEEMRIGDAECEKAAEFSMLERHERQLGKQT